MADKKLLVCNCQKSMQIDGKELAERLGRPEALTVHTELCRAQIAAFEGALGDAGGLLVACTQEAPLFREVAGEKGADAERLSFVNIRERAGWCSAKSAALPKMAALIAEAAHTPKPAGEVTLVSEGVCLVYGSGQQALDVAVELAGRLSVSVLLSEAADVMPPTVVSVPIYKGRVRTAKGHLGAFEIEVDGYAPMLPSSRGGLEFTLARDGAKSTCDIILDLAGGAPLFAGHDKRDGYVRAEPGNPAAVARAMFKASDLVGEFTKPRYVAFDASICAHARSGIVGCRNCLDVCPTGAITPAGDHVAIDAAICGGCGSCSAVCPTGASSYDYPGRGDILARAQLLLGAFARAGGSGPVVLLHDEAHGSGLIAAMARYGEGLPVNVLPMALQSVFQTGHDILAGLLAAGAQKVVILAPPEDAVELPALEREVGLAEAIVAGLGLGGPRIAISTERDPDAVAAVLPQPASQPALRAATFATQGGKRQIARLAIAALAGQAGDGAPEAIALPQGAPYGRIHIDPKACTLCLACVGACPAGALADNPERPQVSLTEQACVQCGVCRATCPEKAITLEARYDLTPAAMTPVVLNSEEPFCCIRCGKPFGAKSSIERVVDRLRGHSMFKDPGRLELIQMCDNCRVIAGTESTDDPFRGPARPRMRTTDDDLAEQAAARQAGKKPLKPDDFLG